MSVAWAFRFGPALVPALLVLLILFTLFVFSISSLIPSGSRFTCRVGNVSEWGWQVRGLGGLPHETSDTGVRVQGDPKPGESRM